MASENLNEKQSTKPVETETTAQGSNNPAEPKCSQARRRNFKLGLQVTGLLVVIVYTVFSGCQAYYSRQQAGAAIEASKAATESFKTLKEQFKMDQRPRISIINLVLTDLTTEKSIRLPIKGKPIVVDVNFQNIGKSQAINVIGHRHLLFGNHVHEFRTEPPDTGRDGDTLEPGKRTQTTAVSLRDTFANETEPIPRSTFVNWDGSWPIMIFGRFSYEDTFEKQYCLPYAEELLANGAWHRLTAKDNPTINELCPVGKP